MNQAITANPILLSFLCFSSPCCYTQPATMGRKPVVERPVPATPHTYPIRSLPHDSLDKAYEVVMSLVATVCTSMKQSRDLITTEMVAFSMTCLVFSVTEGQAAGTIEAAMDIHGRGRGCRFGI
ncbi:hypothetical protein BDA96_06G276500 [Sorghum bicolor]|uniref:BURP domain-containing protein n=2 Tax=Sorghum bicolor TaxID=4558 RepID=A0A921UDW8_SORBI|nr:hypothetical protein BDA96_06G276500 [Sorghum bicolor]KXG27330.1 hypothetical protein SORBI_3006G252800 [Sorghum bicolor]